MRLRVLDLFSGLGGFSEAFLRRGHEVFRVDNDVRFAQVPCTIIGDVREIDIEQFVPIDVVLASPPCETFTRRHLPWLDARDGEIEEAMLLVEAAVMIIDDLEPQFWVLENVQGAVPHISRLLGPPRQRIGSRYLWGVFPRIHLTPQEERECYGKYRLPPSVPNRAAERARIPYVLSLALCRAMEEQQTLLEVLEDER